MSNCFNSGLQTVGSALQVQAGTCPSCQGSKPELPGGECGSVHRTQSCHLISAYCDYLFKNPPVTLWQRSILKGGRANKDENKIKKKWMNTRETAGGIVQISLRRRIHSEVVTLQSPLRLRASAACMETARCFHAVADSSCLLIGSLTGMPTEPSTPPPNDC